VKRALILIGALAFILGLAMLIVRPSAPPPATQPYARAKGASLVTTSGLALSFRRDGEVHALEPGTPLHAGDVLRFKVRAERARQLVVRMRDGDAAATTVFPAGGAKDAVLVQPGDVLPFEPVIAPGAGKVVVTAIFSDHAFSLDGPRASDVEEIDVVTEKQ
jgi:hypothetical protein